MNIVITLIIAVVLVIPVLWLVSEFKFGKCIRIPLGGLAILCSFAAAAVIYIISATSIQFNDNACYGRATKDLINTTVAQIEDGQLDRVMKVLRGLNSLYNPSYQEDSPNYVKLVSEATSRMRGESESKDNSKWNVQPFGINTWVGHWEGNTGFWIVISISFIDKQPYEIIRSGCPETKMSAVSVSEDYRTLKFQDSNNMMHILKLVNKYEAIHEWHDLDKNQDGENRRDNLSHLFKLTRPTEDQKKVTGQIIQGIPTNRSSQP